MHTSELRETGDLAEAFSAPAAERDLLSSVCHDLKGPLASMTMGVAFLRRAVPRTEEPTSRVVDALHRASQRMARTLASFSDLARLRTSEIALSTRPTRVGDILETASNSFASESAADNIPLAVDVEAGTTTVRVLCDDVRLLQALWHLFACVSSVSPAAERVTLRAAHDRDHDTVRFEVAAACAQRQSKRPSVDLPKPDLAIARSLIGLHGGDLDVAADEDALRLSFAIPVDTALPGRREWTLRGLLTSLGSA